MDKEKEGRTILEMHNSVQEIREVANLGQQVNDEETVGKPNGKNLTENENMAENEKEQFETVLEQNRTFMANNKKLRQLVKKLEEDVSSRGKENAELESTNKTLNTQVQELTQLVKKLEEDVSSHGKENAELESTNRTLNTQVQELTQLVKKLEEDVSSHGKENAELESTNRTLNTQVQELTQLVKELEEDVSSRSNRSAELECANKALNTHVQELSIQVHDLKEDIAMLDTTLKEAVEARDKYAETNESLEAEVNRLNKDIGTKEGENTETILVLRQEIMRLGETINTLNEEKENEKEKHDLEKKELVNSKNNLYGEVDRIKYVMKTMSEESKRIAETNEKLQIEKEKQTEQLVSTTEQNKTLEEKLEYLTEKLSAGLQEEIDDILSLGHYLDTQGKKYIIVQEDAETKRGEELNALQEQVSKLQGEKKSLETMIKDTEVQKDVLSEKLNNLNNEKVVVEISIEELRKEKQRIETELRLDNQKLKSEFGAMLRAIEEQLAAKIKESDAIDEEKEGLANELTKVADSKRVLEMEVDIMENVISNQVMKIDDLSTKCYLSKELEADLQSKTQLIESLYEENDLLHREVEYKTKEAEKMSQKCELWMTLVEERVRAYDSLKDNYNTHRRFVERACNGIDLERIKMKILDNEILIAVEKLDSVVSTDHLSIGHGTNRNVYDQNRPKSTFKNQYSSSEGIATINRQSTIDQHSTEEEPSSSSFIGCSPIREYTTTLRPVTPEYQSTIDRSFARERSFTTGSQSSVGHCSTSDLRP